MSENWELVKSSELSKSFNVSNAYQIKPMSLCDVLTIFFFYQTTDKCPMLC